MKIAVITGSRSWTDVDAIRRALAAFAPDVVLEGGARGADRLARDVARNDLGVHVAQVAALWHLGRAAGHVRNRTLMDLAAVLAAGGAEVVVFAFDRGTPGTRNAIAAATKRGLPVRRCSI